MSKDQQSLDGYQWRDHIDIVDSSLSRKAIENVVLIDTQMLFHMDNLQAKVQQDLTKFQPVIVAEFTPGGGKFTLLHSVDGNESRNTIEPVPNLFGLAKSVAHAPLGIFGCFGPYATDPENQDWREPLADYLTVLKNALDTIGDIGDGFGITPELRSLLVTELNKVTGLLDGASPVLTAETVDDHVVAVLTKLLQSSIAFIETEAFPLSTSEAPTDVFQRWCNQSSDDPNNPDDTLYKLIAQCQVMSATAQYFGISGLMTEWRNAFDPKTWAKLYVIVEAEWVTREQNSIAQCILPEMTDGQDALNQHLLIVTNLGGVDPALHFLARILEDRSGAAMILTDHASPRTHLSGQVDLLAPVMHDVIACPHIRQVDPTSDETA